jgi:hypothetical protein
MQPTGMERLSLLIVFLLCLAATAIAQNCGKLEAGLVLTIFAVASGAFVEQVMIIVHLPRIVKATVDPVEAAAAAAVVAVEVARVLPMLELHTISTTLSKMDGT